jgi:tRNA(Ile2) C34 agmatinyltransferase TiaS
MTALPLNCPTCGAAMSFVRSEGETLIYRCPRHGLLMLPPDGRIRPLPQ